MSSLSPIPSITKLSYYLSIYISLQYHSSFSHIFHISHKQKSIYYYISILFIISHSFSIDLYDIIPLLISSFDIPQILPISHLSLIAKHFEIDNKSQINYSKSSITHSHPILFCNYQYKLFLSLFHSLLLLHFARSLNIINNNI